MHLKLFGMEKLWNVRLWVFPHEKAIFNFHCISEFTGENILCFLNESLVVLKRKIQESHSVIKVKKKKGNKEKVLGKN